MLRPSPRLGSGPHAPVSNPDSEAIRFERRLRLAQASGDSIALKELRREHDQSLAASEALARLKALIPGSIPVGRPAACTADREQAIREELRNVPSGCEGNSSRSTLLYAWYAVGEYDQALTELERLCLDAELDWELKCMFALCLLRLGHWQRAFEWFQHAASLDAKRPMVHAGLGFAARSMGRPREALVHYRRALHLDGEIAEMHFLTGDALNCLEHYGKAHQAFGRAARLAPENLGYRKHQAEALERMRIEWGSADDSRTAPRFEVRRRERFQEDRVPSIAEVLSRKLRGNGKRKDWSPTALAASKRRRRKFALWLVGGLLLATAFLTGYSSSPQSGYAMGKTGNASLQRVTLSATD